MVVYCLPYVAYRPYLTPDNNLWKVVLDVIQWLDSCSLAYVK